ncbi:MAG: AI-2E family transporter, partial [Gammaproteobacteria bacterium]|nr:AI-2E family transporter [Gammaproteobacteria bacterium]
KLPLYLDYLQLHFIPSFSAALGLEPMQLDLSALKKVAVEEWQKTGGLFANLLRYLSHSGVLLLAWLANLVLIPVVTFYLLRDWDILIERLDEMLPRSQAPTVRKLALESDRVLEAFLRGQLSVMAALALIYSLGLWLAGVELALLIGTFAGLVSFVPYLGFILGLLLASVAMLFQQPELAALLPVLLVFVIGQVIEGALLTPWLVGDRIGLHPVMVIFSVLAGGQLFGFVGILLALPVAAVIAVLMRHVHEQYRQSEFYDSIQEPSMEPLGKQQGDKE